MELPSILTQPEPSTAVAVMRRTPSTPVMASSMRRMICSSTSCGEATGPGNRHGRACKLRCRVLIALDHREADDAADQGDNHQKVRSNRVAGPPGKYAATGLFFGTFNHVLVSFAGDLAGAGQRRGRAGIGGRCRFIVACRFLGFGGRQARHRREGRARACRRRRRARGDVTANSPSYTPPVTTMRSGRLSTTFTVRTRQDHRRGWTTSNLIGADAACCGAG